MNAPEHAVTAAPSTTQPTHTLLWVADIIQSPTNPRKHFNTPAQLGAPSLPANTTRNGNVTTHRLP